VYYLELLHLSGAGKKIDQRPIEGQGQQVARLEFRRSDVLDKAGLWVGLWICFVEAIDVFNQGMVGAAVAFGQQEAACISAVRRDAADTRRMFPDGERRVAVADHCRGRFDEKREHMSKNFRRNRHYAIRREQRPEKMRIAESIDDPQLR